MSEKRYEDWVVVFESGTDYEGDLVRDRLDDAGIPAVVLTQRDHAFNLTVGDLSQVKVLVPPEHAETVATILESEPPTDEELEEAALAASPSVEELNPKVEDILDSGSESIHLSVPTADAEPTSEEER